jgi:hypothetical protein
MSVFFTATAKCPKCGTEEEVQLAASVNADRRPDLRAAILDGSFQATDCPNCGTRMRLPAHMTYISQQRGQWILVDAPDALSKLADGEAEAHAVFDGLYGPHAPDVAQEIGRELKPRLVFGWPALREKLLCGDHHIDDTTLELLKIAVLRNVPNPPLADQTELRLVGQTDGTLNFAWIESATEKYLSTLAVPRDVYDGIASDAAWAPLRSRLDGQYFVDLKRLLVA